MPNYRRMYVPGGCYFFTVALWDRRSRLLVERITDLERAIADVQRRWPFEIDTQVILPDHLHTIWVLPDGDMEYSLRWRQIKIRFSKSIAKGEFLSPARERRGERGIWQRRFWEHTISDENDYANHVDYCWYNPVKHELVNDVRDWPHSTFHRDCSDEVSLDVFNRRALEFASSGSRKNFGEESRDA